MSLSHSQSQSHERSLALSSVSSSLAAISLSGTVTGLTVLSFREWLEEKFGDAGLATILAQPCLPREHAAVFMEQDIGYQSLIPERAYLSIIRATMDMSGLSQRELLFEFGEFFLHWMVDRSGYHQAIKRVSNTFHGFARCLNPLLVQMYATLGNPKPGLPQVQVTDVTPSSFTLGAVVPDGSSSNRNVVLLSVYQGMLHEAATQVFGIQLEFSDIAISVLSMGQEYLACKVKVSSQGYADTAPTGAAAATGATGTTGATGATEQLSSLPSPQSWPEHGRGIMGLDPDAFEKLFPFHFVLDLDFRVLQAGEALRRMLPQMGVPDMDVREVLTIRLPRLLWSMDSLHGVLQSDMRSKVVLSSASGIDLHGGLHVIRQMRRDRSTATQDSPQGRLVDGEQALVFLGSPYIASIEDMERHDLFMSDFPPHEAAADHVLMAAPRHAKTTEALREAQRNAEALKETLAEALAVQADEAGRPAINIESAGHLTLRLLDSLLMGNDLSAQEVLDVRAALLRAGTNLWRPLDIDWGQAVQGDNEVNEALAKMLGAPLQRGLSTDRLSKLGSDGGADLITATDLGELDDADTNPSSYFGMDRMDSGVKAWGSAGGSGPGTATAAGSGMAALAPVGITNNMGLSAISVGFRSGGGSKEPSQGGAGPGGGIGIGIGTGGCPSPATGTPTSSAAAAAAVAAAAAAGRKLSVGLTQYRRPAAGGSTGQCSSSQLMLALGSVGGGAPGGVERMSSGVNSVGPGADALILQHQDSITGGGHESPRLAGGAGGAAGAGLGAGPSGRPYSGGLGSRRNSAAMRSWGAGLDRLAKDGMVNLSPGSPLSGAGAASGGGGAWDDPNASPSSKGGKAAAFELGLAVRKSSVTSQGSRLASTSTVVGAASGPGPGAGGLGVGVPSGSSRVKARIIPQNSGGMGTGAGAGAGVERALVAAGQLPGAALLGDPAAVANLIDPRREAAVAASDRSHTSVGPRAPDERCGLGVGEPGDAVRTTDVGGGGHAKGQMPASQAHVQVVGQAKGKAMAAGVGAAREVGCVPWVRSMLRALGGGGGQAQLAGSDKEAGEKLAGSDKEADEKLAGSDKEAGEKLAGSYQEAGSAKELVSVGTQTCASTTTGSMASVRYSSGVDGVAGVDVSTLGAEAALMTGVSAAEDARGLQVAGPVRGVEEVVVGVSGVVGGQQGELLGQPPAQLLQASSSIPARTFQPPISLPIPSSVSATLPPSGGSRVAAVGLTDRGVAAVSGGADRAVGTASAAGVEAGVAGSVEALPTASAQVAGVDGTSAPDAGAGAAGAAKRALPGGATLERGLTASIEGTPLVMHLLLRPGDQLSAALAKVDDWQFDSFALEAAANGRPLSSLGFHLIKRMGLTQALGLDETKLARFLMHIEDGYGANPYHCKTHAADVLRSLHAVLTRGEVLTAISLQSSNSRPHRSGMDHEASVRLLTCYLSAIVHDYEHRGVNNDFLIKSSDPLALRYNDQSPLENHHVSASFCLMQHEQFDFLPQGSKRVREVLRRDVIDLVLGTDMKQHFALTGTFSLKVAAEGLRCPDTLTRAESTIGALRRPLGATRAGGSHGEEGRTSQQQPVTGHTGRLRGGPAAAVANGRNEGTSNSNNSLALQAAHEGWDRETQMLVLKMALKAADLGHLTSSIEVHKQWVARLEEELFRQGDQEKALGHPVSPLMDRSKTGITKSQCGFFNIVARPMYQSFVQAFPASKPLLSALDANHEAWKAIEAQAQSESHAS